jgi:hypothetical protein
MFRPATQPRTDVMNWKSPKLEDSRNVCPPVKPLDVRLTPTETAKASIARARATARTTKKFIV